MLTRFVINKKLFFLVFICSLVFFMGQIGREEEGKPIVIADTGFRNIFDVEIKDVTLETSFVSDPFLKFHVPPSPKSFTILFKCWNTFVYAWSDYDRRHIEYRICLRVISDIIPYSMEVWTAAGLPSRYVMESFSDSKTKSQRIEHFTEIFMKRDGEASWSVNYKSGEKVQDWKATRIFTELIDKGFDVEVWVEGMTQGMKVASCRSVTIEVLRLSH